MDRRGVLGGIGAAAVLAAVAGEARASGIRPALLSAAQRRLGGFVAAGIDRGGAVVFEVPLPGRGHGAAVDPEGRHAVVFARRPGTFALAIDLGTGDPLAEFACPADRHFQGHGCFSPDGRFLYTAENDFDGERGVIGVYDARAGFRRVGELDAHGVGIHEVILMRDGRTLAAANGGILTHPDYPRAKLNIPSMEPSLVFLEPGSGHLLAKFEPVPRLRQLSIRHLAEARDGEVWFGCQYEGPVLDQVPLIGKAGAGDRTITWIRPNHPDQERALRQYVGSIAATGDGAQVAVSSPRGGVCYVLDSASGRLDQTWQLPDVCGLAGRQSAIIASTGSGLLWDSGHPLSRAEDFAWDNHLRAL